jgi:hypothetical protein
MNVGIGTVAVQFISWEYLFRIFSTVSLQYMCGTTYIDMVVVTPRTYTYHSKPCSQILSL